MPRKRCSYDCVYCQAGRTTQHTLDRSLYAPTEAVVEQLRGKLCEEPPPDYVTLSGSGEPTLASNIGEVLARVRGAGASRTAVLTNASLLWREDVRDELSLADLVVPSIDAATEQTWRRLNRPAPGLSFERVLGGLRDFCDGRRGETWLEVLLVEGYNDGPDELAALAREVGFLKAARVQVHTSTRPAARPGVRAVPRGTLESLARLIGPRAEVVEGYRGSSVVRAACDTETVLALLARRPCTVDDVAHGLGLHHAEVAKALGLLVADGKVRSEEVGGREYFGLTD